GARRGREGHEGRAEEGRAEEGRQEVIAFFDEALSRNDPGHVPGSFASGGPKATARIRSARCFQTAPDEARRRHCFQASPYESRPPGIWQGARFSCSSLVAIPATER